MQLKQITDDQKNQYNSLVSHVMQSWEWGEFRKSLGTPVLRYGLYEKDKLVTAFQLTLHQIPLTDKYVGYLPKGPFPDKNLAEALQQIAKEQNCAFIKVEPNIIESVIPVHTGIQKEDNLNDSQSTSLTSDRLLDPRLRGDDKQEIPTEFIKSPKPLFTKYNFVVDLTKSEEELLKNMHTKTRYNIRVAQKHGVKIEETTDDKALEIYLKLYFDTTKRQNYHGHTPAYHKKLWATLKKAGMARLLIAYYNDEPLTAWMMMNFKDTLYYPFGGSSPRHREIMHSNLVAWEAIKLGKRLKLKKFDMWGALGPDADTNDPWYGFHRFKQGYGGNLVEYIGTYDLVINYPLYYMFTNIDKFTALKVFLLKLLGK